VLFISLYLQGFAWAQNELISVDARSAALSDAVLVTSSPGNYFGNPAGWNPSGKISMGVHYASKYFVHNLSVKSISAVIPINNTVAGFGISSGGFDLFNENVAGIGISRNIFSHIVTGVKIKYYYFHIENSEQSQDAASFEWGMTWLPGKKFSYGLWFINPVSSPVSTPRSLTIFPEILTGVSYSGNDYLISMQSGWEKEFTLSLGIEYDILDQLYLRAGIFKKTYRGYSFGFGYLWKNLRIDGSFSSHPILGQTPYVSLIYFIKR
jgi:hypothetical protein